MKNTLFFLTAILLGLICQAQKCAYTINSSATSMVAFTPDGNQLIINNQSYSGSTSSFGKVSITSASSIDVFDCKDFKPASKSSDLSIYSKAFALGNAKGISAEIKGKKITLNIPGEKPVVLKGHTGNVESVSFNHSGTLALSIADGEPKTYVWNTVTGELIKKIDFRAHTIVFSTDDQLLIMDDCLVNPSDFTVLFEFKVYPSAVCAAFTSDKRFVAIGFSQDSRTNDSCVKIYNTQSGAEVGKLLNPSGTEWRVSVAFSPDGKYLAGTCNYCKNTLVWDVSAITH